MKAKVFKIFFLLGFSIAVLTSCSENPEIVSPTIDNADLKKGQVFSVYPTGIPETDWQNIVNAFEQASSAGSGNIVRLEAGHFRIHKEILVEGFNGTFCGAGKDITIIEPGLSSGNKPFKGLAGVIFLESEEELHIIDMTMQVTHPTPTKLKQFDYGLGWFFIVNHVVNCNTSFERVCIKGAEGQYPSWAPAGFKKLNNAHGVWVCSGFIPLIFNGGPGDYVGGNHTTANCDFIDIGSLCHIVGGLKDATITIGGSPNHSNTFEGVWCGFNLYDVSNCQVEISYNEFKNNPPDWWDGVQIYPCYYSAPWIALLPPPPNASNCVVSNNDFTVQGVGGGIFIADWTYAFYNQKGIKAVFTNNNFTLENPYWTGIWVRPSCYNNIISNNIFNGNPRFAGIAIEGYNNMLLANNVQNVYGCFAPIFLLEPSAENNVVGGSNKTNVLDFGTDNILTGVNIIQGNPPGPELQAALQRKHDLMKQ